MKKFLKTIPKILIFQFLIILFIYICFYLVISTNPKFYNHKIYKNTEKNITYELISDNLCLNKNEIHSFESKYTKLDNEVIRLTRFLKRYGSPIASPRYSKIIIETSKQNGVDYRLNVGIMLAESGICKHPMKNFNCYGYMNNVYYSSFEEALEVLTAKVSRQYTSKYAWNIELMGTKYGAHNVSSWKNKVLYAKYKI
ncbi:hypothetical protein GF362_02200 [Candidatus Dojkabacteria bacterium]|nr:hypothetical protein [Candidatus Dojkabacteria bacterium]